MKITNQERVSRAFTILKDELAPHVVTALEKSDGKEWSRRVRETLRREDASYGSADEPLHLDVAALLFIIWNRWNDCFSLLPKFSHTTRSYVSELRESRNIWAHQIEFDDDMADRTIGSARLLIKAFSGMNHQELLDLRNEITASALPVNSVRAKQVTPKQRLAKQESDPRE